MNNTVEKKREEIIKLHQLYALCAVIAHLEDGGEIGGIDDSADAMDIAGQLAYLLEENFSSFMRKQEETGDPSPEMYEAHAAAQALANFADFLCEEDRGAVQSFFSMAYLTKKAIDSAIKEATE